MGHNGMTIETAVADQVRGDWTILSNHGVVLFQLGAKPNATIRRLSTELGLTERTVYRIIRDLEGAEMVSRQRVGRRNTYSLNPDACLRHPTLSHLPLSRLFAAFSEVAETAGI
jgi:DNA-binding transcriptional ArsR family regulator